MTINITGGYNNFQISDLLKQIQQQELRKQEGIDEPLFPQTSENSDLTTGTLNEDVIRKQLIMPEQEGIEGLENQNSFIDKIIEFLEGLKGNQESKDSTTDKINKSIGENTTDYWKQADLDQDGFLSEDELYKQAQSLLKEFDENAYDDEGNLTADGIKSLNGLMNEETIKEMDTDGNGKIDAGEYEDFYKKFLEEENKYNFPRGIYKDLPKESQPIKTIEYNL